MRIADRSLISTMAGTASRTWPKNSRHTVRVWAWARCRMKRAEVMMPSQPSFWMPGRPDRNLSVTSLPSPALRNALPGMVRISGSPCGVLPSGSKRLMRNARHVHIVDLAEVVVEALDFHPQPVRRDHAPRRQVVQRGAPQHGLLAARVHRHIAADAGGVGRSRVDREHQIGGFRRFHHAPRDHARAAMDGGDGLLQARQVPACSTADSASSFSVLITAENLSSGTAPPV